MGSFNGVAICDLVSLYLLDKISSLIWRKNVELYQDDRLAGSNSSSGPALDKMRNNIIALFKQYPLKLISLKRFFRT